MRLVLVTSLHGLPVVSHKEKVKIGTVGAALFDTDHGVILGLTIRRGLLAPLKFVAVEDIKEIDKTAIDVTTPKDVFSLADEHVANRVYKKGVSLINLKVVTTTGRKLGKVSDLAISFPSGQLAQIYIVSYWKERIIPREKIVEVTKNKIVIDDDTKASKSVEMNLPIKAPAHN